MKLKRFKCESPCSTKDRCAKMPIEIHGSSDSVDMLIITEFPGKKESEEQRYLVGKHGDPVRNILKWLEKDFPNYSYAIAGLYKGTSNREEVINKATLDCCANILKREVNLVKPKVIVAMGAMVYEYFHGKECPFGDLVEDGKMSKVSVFGKKREVLFCVHPTWHTSQSDSCAIGFVYENLRKALDFAINGVDWRIPNTFKTTIIETIPDLKDMLQSMRRVRANVAIDSEANNLNRVYDNKVISLQFCNDGETGYLVPLDHFDSPLRKKLKKAWSLIGQFLTKPTKVTGYIYVNAKFDFHQIFREAKIFSFNAPLKDVSFAEFSLDENWTRVFGMPKGKGRFSLFSLAYRYGFNYYAETGTKDLRDRLAYIPMAEWADYAGADVVAPWNIYNRQTQTAKRTGYLKKFSLLNDVFYNHLCRATTYAEHCGLSLNKKVLKELASSSGVFDSAIADIINQFFTSPNVSKTNSILVKDQLGLNGKGLFGETRVFNPSKALHRSLLYFDVMGLEPVEEEDGDGNGGESTDKSFQKAYAGTPEVDLLAEFNSITKMKTGFVTPVWKWIRKTSPEARPDFFMDMRSRGSFLNDAVTGRLKCVKPNQQQRPSRGKQVKKILAMYEPPRKRIVIKMDFSTFEVRGLGFISFDKAMIASFREMHKLKLKFRKDPTCFAKLGYDIHVAALKKDKAVLLEHKGYISDLPKADAKKAKVEYKVKLEEYKKKVQDLEDRYANDPISLSKEYLEFMTDFHRRSAALFNKIGVEEVSKPMRQGAKGLVFGSIYGRSVQSIAKELGIEETLAQSYFDAFMAAMPEAGAWLEEKKEEGRENLFVESFIGRRRRVWGHLYNNKSFKSKMDRYSMNTIIQGVCSDLNLEGSSLLISFFEAHDKAKYQVPDEEAWFSTNLIHDSNEMEAPVEDAYYLLKSSECLFTTLLEEYVREVFDFDIQVPLEVDYTVGINYANTKDWNGSDLHARELQKWLCEEAGKRDDCVYDYEKAINHPYFKEMKGVAKRVVQEHIAFAKKSLKYTGVTLDV